MAMRLDFPVFKEKLESISNYDLYLMPNGIYRTKEVRNENYLYPAYYLKEGDDYVVSTSVYNLIRYKKRFIRNPKFQATLFYRPSFLTIDSEIKRVRTFGRRSTKEITDKDTIVKKAAQLIQGYVTEMEERYPGYVHILLMGGKDSENIILTKRNERWVVVSAAPNDTLNDRFLKDNGIKVDRYMPISNKTDNTFLLQEVMASDCSCGIAHFRWVKILNNLIEEFDGKIVLWMGSAADVLFKPNVNHKDRDYYAVFDLQLGMLNGIWHQLYKNLFNIPVVSPYQSPRFLDDLFYRFDPYFSLKTGDVRPEIGNSLYGRCVKYPSGPLPLPSWERRYDLTIPMYVGQLKREGIRCRAMPVQSGAIKIKERVINFLDRHSSKRRNPLSRVLFPLREVLSKVMPPLENKRLNIAAREIK